MPSLADLINNPRQLNAETLPRLKQLVDDFPYYHAARLLYVANLYALHDPAFSAEMSKAGVMLPDASPLFTLVEGQMADEASNTSPSHAGQSILTEDDDRTSSLIDNFLSTSKRTSDNTPSDPTPRTVPTLADVTSDYAAFLELQPDTPNDEETTEEMAKKAELIEQFIEQTKGKQRYELSPEASEAAPSALPPEDASLYNEHIVDLLIQQGNYEQALEILKQIDLTQPQKSATFAARLQLLEEVCKSRRGSEPQ